MDKAVFTIAKDENYFLPIWYKYYQKFFGKDIFILNNGSKIDLPGVIPARHDYSFDVKWLLETAKDYQKILLDKYDMVLFAESDEIVVSPDDFQTKINGAVSCLGWEVIHTPKEEKLDWEKPILKQRKYWVSMHNFNKPLWSSIPLDWNYGFHRCKQDAPVLPGMVLIHLRRADYDSCKARWEERREWKRPPGQDSCFSKQWTKSFAFGDWFRNHGPLVEIPEIYKDVV